MDGWIDRAGRAALALLCMLVVIDSGGLNHTRPNTQRQELTCDYTLFESEAGDAAILQCQCGAGADCLGQVLGFKVCIDRRAVVPCLVAFV